MILIAHILVASFSVLYTAFVFISPSKRRLYEVYALVALTFLSGFYLVWSRPVHILQVCTEGLVYLGVMLAGIVSVRHKLRAYAKNNL